MEQLKRWREERAARQSLRILGPNPGAWTLPRRATRVSGEPRRGFHLWPIPLPISPVHPEWDDPTGGRLKKGLYNSMIGHALVVPAIILLGNLDIDFHGNRVQSVDRPFAVVILPPAGGRKATPRPPASVPPAVKQSAPEPKPTTQKPTPKPVNRDVKEAIPVPVKPEALIHNRGKENTRPAPEEDAVTDPVATPGPLVAGTGPVAGSDASIGGVDGGSFPYNYYLVIVREKISQAWEIPQGMVARGRRIEATVQFRIMRDGTIAESTIEVPSGQPVYDQSALRAVSLVRKFPPLPQEFGGRFIVVHFQFGYVGR